MHMNGSLYRKRSGSHTWRRSFKPLLPQRLNERGSQSKPPYDARTSRAYLHTRGHSAPAPALWRFSHMSAVSCTRGPKRGWGRVWERERVCVNGWRLMEGGLGWRRRWGKAGYEDVQEPSRACEDLAVISSTLPPLPGLFWFPRCIVDDGLRCDSVL